MQVRMFAVIAALSVVGVVAAQDKQEKKFEITPAIQKHIDEWKVTAGKWAADPVIVKAVQEQNAKGPLANVDEKAWKGLRRRSPEVEAFQNSAAGKQLAALAKTTNSLVSEAFLSAQKGEKVAFLEKTTSYIHAGKPKFDVPFTKLENWQGQPEFDESTQTYAIQVSVPVKETADAKKAIGVLVIGLNLTALANPAPAK